MFKFLVIFGLIIYSIYKIGSFFFRAGAASQQFRNPQRDASNLNSKEKNKTKKGFQGGDYVDYEEIK
jgi:hypothetical protein